MTVITVLREVLASLAYAAQIIAAGVLIYAARSYLLQRRQLNYDVITSCTQRFQDILPSLYSENDRVRKESQRRYVDLCNEELFYFTEGYVPSDVIEEWIDGMVLYLPHHVGEEWYWIPENPDQRHRISPKLLDRYSRIWEVFDVSQRYDSGDKGSRTALVNEIYDKVEQNAKKPGFLSGRRHT